MYQIQGFQFCLLKTKQKNKTKEKESVGITQIQLYFPISVIYQTEDA